MPHQVFDIPRAMALVINLWSSASLIQSEMALTTSRMNLAERNPYYLLLRKMFLLIGDSKSFADNINKGKRMSVCPII